MPKIKLLGTIFLGTVLVLLLKGGNHYDSIINLTKCGLAGDVLIAGHFCISFYLAWKIGWKVINKDERKVMLGYVFLYESDKMSKRKMWSSILSGFFAGLLGGTLGLGGAIILVPVWLNLGIDSQRASSSSPPLIFFSALISFTICLFSGRYRNFI
jgi:uncharacterized membrane protein YfcA